MDFQPPYFPPPFSSSAVSSAGVGPNAAEVFSSHLQSDHYQHYAVSKHYSSHLKQILIKHSLIFILQYMVSNKCPFSWSASQTRTSFLWQCLLRKLTLLYCLEKSGGVFRFQNQNLACLGQGIPPIRRVNRTSSCYMLKPKTSTLNLFIRPVSKAQDSPTPMIVSEETLSTLDFLDMVTRVILVMLSWILPHRL